MNAALDEDLLYRLYRGEGLRLIREDVPSGFEVGDDEGIDEVFDDDICLEEPARRSTRHNESTGRVPASSCSSFGYHSITSYEFSSEGGRFIPGAATSSPIITLQSLTDDCDPTRDSGCAASPESDVFSYNSSDDELRPSEVAPKGRPRSRSCPDLGVRPAVVRTPVPLFQKAISDPHSHCKNWSTPVTYPDGRPVLVAPHKRFRTAESREGLIDLTEDESEGHRRRVLVLSLPDVIVDTEGRAQPTTPPTQFPPGAFPGSEIRPIRPEWFRRRALSCDVTLEAELGIELRRIADEFDRTHCSNTRREDSERDRFLRKFKELFAFRREP